MKIFERDGKINFVDENNVLLGYDMSQDCCEHADWFILDTIYSDKDSALLDCEASKNLVKKLDDEEIGGSTLPSSMPLRRLTPAKAGWLPLGSPMATERSSSTSSTAITDTTDMGLISRLARK